MAFGDSIKTLLETYANCISLLKAFGQTRQDNGSLDARHQNSRLRKSLRSDRSLVERAYSARLSEAGSRLKEGDARAITALDRILKRLRNAIRSLLHLSGKRQHSLDLDYRSLMSLSNASRTGAIKAIDGLSRRLASPSRISVASPSTKASSKGFSSRGERESQSRAGSATHKSLTARKPLKKPKREGSPSKKSPLAVKGVKGTKKATKGEPERARKSLPFSSAPPPISPEKEAQMQTSQVMRSSAKSPEASKTKTAVPNRISILSFSSDSTKLGEIPERKWRSMMHYSPKDPDADEYNVRPMFPLKPYTVEVRERRFFGLFNRRRPA
ncbi:hypothetical protein N657DRAFT_565588 [Parathielavia appendiculata]|uniref:Uncharacterized protein n=1 Tax=Parathielavia appendiculata TaxID=2587402 RepID=A0AAN6Z7A2_9PEZI|nr:hypothetical protein N657DRAFT_565588 [Parathielavia appendiculata]